MLHFPSWPVLFKMNETHSVQVKQKQEVRFNLNCFNSNSFKVSFKSGYRINSTENSPFCSFTPGGLNLLTGLDSASEPYCWRSDARRSNNGRIIWMSGGWRSQSAVWGNVLYHHTHASLTGQRCCCGHIWRGSAQSRIHIILIISPFWGESEIYISLNQDKSSPKLPDRMLLRNASAHLSVLWKVWWVG